ncbi:hypothetical protein ACH5RR_029562 [Cinchona calisaya]|uniref:Reverse transcriptase Ty1/copia-type domain-containing protein n=1 Tax=Cinchona calisaya TaxID=153742 RepID=A0ABD2YUB1_9GENT
MVTRAQTGKLKPIQPRSMNANVQTPADPSCYSQAVKYFHWRSAMTDEYNALISNSTWELLPPSLDQHIIGCKLVFCTKTTSDGSLDRHKARLVAKGYHQRPMLILLRLIVLL